MRSSASVAFIEAMFTIGPLACARMPAQLTSASTQSWRPANDVTAASSVMASGAGGFLAGCTIWLDAVRRYFPGRQAFADSLRKDGVAVLERLSDLTKAKAKPWTAHFPGFADIEQEGDFARAY